jgi:transcription elongation factor GreA
MTGLNENPIDVVSNGIFCNKREDETMYDRLTRQDVEKMEKELEHRKLVVRKEALEDVKEARAQGDLSENFEYKAAKKVKNRNESRIRYLERMIKTAQIVEDDAGEEELGLNDTVVVYVPEDDCEEEYKIVTTIRADVMNNMISIESPMGKCLLKHRVGDTVTIELENGVKYDVVIREIRKSDDESEEISRF